ncbi:hypothetical protein [Bacillus sp. MUM 13]|uniref:hypothetical protein n=1 Tax=Bacillus sp. MUM 13 TaxID=1678001 RepID=UPI0008F56DA8|nr:hypothetical protein [Bacillus sp. MUM 13]OIK11139.1 hypothetical protein BIV59_13035 [Bacillus sp. MUM 13]
MKQRLLLCLLLCGVLLYYAAPRLSFEQGGAQSAFAGTWLVFAFCAAAGNLTGMLYTPKKRKRISKEKRPGKKRVHYYQ